MTKKKLILIGGIIVLCLLICLCVAMCSPAEQGESETPEPTGTTGSSSMTYTVQVKAAGGTPLEGIGVYIYEDLKMQELVWFAKTDASGMLTFEDIASDNFVAVLADVPAGYLVEEYYPLTGENTEIVLESGLMEGDLSAITYKLGDLMLDFSVTAPDGTVYTFSELLKEKNAVVLNFWYLQCEPCKSEFPYLQEAYEKYSEDVIVLAMNPVNTDDTEIAQFQKDNGYTFPMAKCDPLWEKAMQLTAYPTTVVIDRYGNICLIHKGSVTDAETFENMFAFYSDEEYEQTIVKDLEEMEEAAGIEQTVGTEDNPVQMGVTPSFQVTVEPGQLMHYEIYRMVTTLYLTVQNENAYIIYNGQTYYPTNGTISIPVATDGTSSTLKLVFGNSGSKTETYTVTMASAAGTFGNPYTLKLGDFTAKVPAGTESGINYIYTADKNGLFTIEIDSVTAGVDYNIELNTLTKNGIGSIQRTTESDSVVDETTGKRSVSVYVYKGRTVRVVVGTLPDSSNLYPAATFKLNASLDENAEEGATQKELTAYSINVTDESGNPISGVKLSMTVDGKEQMLTTTEGSVITRQTPGTYPVVLVVPRGYTAKTTEFKLTETYPSISIKLDTIEKVTYSVTVTNEATGAVISGAEVYFYDGAGELLTSATTDAKGKASITMPKGSYTASVSKDGFIPNFADITPETKDITIGLVEGSAKNAKTYTVSVKDYYGNPMSDVTVIFKQGMFTYSVKAKNGEAEKELPAGTYTVGVSGNYYSPGTTLDENTLTGSIVVVKGVSGETGKLYESDTYYVYEGVTYLSDLTSNTDNHFLFYPEEPGVYRFTVTDPNKMFTTTNTRARISYWGTNTANLQDITDILDDEIEGVYDMINNTFTVNVREKNLGGTHIIGITKSTKAILNITRISDPILDETDIEPEVYKAVNKIDQNFSLKTGTEFTYMDVTGGSVTYVKGSDGYYHLNDTNGPILYVNLGITAPYLSMSNCMSVTDEHAVFLIVETIFENDKPVKRIRYNECMTDYVNARCENTDVYPLTDDLILMFQKANEIKGWADPENPNFIFLNKNGEKMENVNADVAWMYAVCYIKK